MGLENLTRPQKILDRFHRMRKSVCLGRVVEVWRTSYRGKETERKIVIVIEKEIATGKGTESENDVIGIGIVIGTETAIGTGVETEIEAGTEMPIGIGTGIGRTGPGERIESEREIGREIGSGKEVLVVLASTRTCLVTETGIEVGVVVGVVVRVGEGGAENVLRCRWSDCHGRIEAITRSRKGLHYCQYLRIMWFHHLTITPTITTKARVQGICTGFPRTCTLILLRDHRIITTWPDHIPEANASRAMALGSEARARRRDRRDRCCTSLRINPGRSAPGARCRRNAMRCFLSGSDRARLLRNRRLHCALQRGRTRLPCNNCRAAPSLLKTSFLSSRWHQDGHLQHRRAEVRPAK